MPRGDGTGPHGQGPRTGRGRGGCGKGMGRGGQGGVGGQRVGAGPSGFCVCPSCGEKVPHKAGTPCSGMSCPKCKAMMTRE